MNNPPPLQGALADADGKATAPWANWLSQVFAGLGWKKAFNVSADLDFPGIAALSQQPLTVAVKGARPGDAVTVTPAADVAGVFFTGIVTAADTVTVYAKNYSVGAVNPASQAFRIIVIQN